MLGLCKNTLTTQRLHTPHATNKHTIQRMHNETHTNETSF